ncbi:MAG: alpha-glucan family phosphorylase [Gammaproteobacteria bacterium]|nr:alpha-glucan family phosphorylase [Gammaproteobacteria bacterium]
MMNETIYELEVRPFIPDELFGLIELSNNLLYSWDRNARGLFYRLDPKLWEQCDHNPKVFLRRVSQRVLEEAIQDNVFMEEYSRVISTFESYLAKNTHHDIDEYLDVDNDLIAYFCAEFGLHESFPIYSGGLGILAGDHCKAVSDLGVPFVAIGLLYRQGYFSQEIDACGNQVAIYNTTRFSELPIERAVNSKGEKITITVDMAGHEVKLKAWKAMTGHTTMYFLDSNVAENSEQDRQITFRLYGGDKTTRIQQEIVLGIGGVRLIRELGLTPTAWHINEGHAAFQIIERCREILGDDMDFASALEQVAAGTVFTTHTPVPAGHDIFDKNLMIEYFSNCCKRLNIDFDDFMSFGHSPIAENSFNMTAFALRGSRFHNGVSQIHGNVASNMESYVWPQIPVNENPIRYVTNGVHAPTFLAREWLNLFDMRFREWRNKLLDDDYWACIDEIPDHRFWSLRQELKSQMLNETLKRTNKRYKRNHSNDALISHVTQSIVESESDVLVLGFARRFATYKRATLLFSDPERLARLLNDPERPVVLMFAGKAHPKDDPGQTLIRTIHEFAHRPEFLGKIILLEGYNMAMARNLVTGVDVWINTPEYPMEASGTSGQKAAINGVLNLSVLDGWWGEGFNGKNGWGISPHGPETTADVRDREEANELLEILEYEIIPTFYNRGKQGYSKDWVKLSKESMKSCIPQFNASRMVMDYVKNFYTPATIQYRRMKENNSAPAKELAKWKAKIHAQWHNIKIERVDDAATAINDGEALSINIKAYLNGLSPEDVAVECMVDTSPDQIDENLFDNPTCYRLNYVREENGSHIFSLDLQPVNSGINYYKIRIFPYHELLSHPLETGYMIWL